jgi:hypothetical protein
MGSEPPAPEERKSTSSMPPLASGVAVLLYGLVALYVPTYMQLQGVAATLVYVVAVALLTISVGVTFSEAAQLWKREALNSLGNGLAFLVPTAVLFAFTAIHRTFPSPWHQLAQCGALVSAFFAILFLSGAIVSLPTLLVSGERALPDGESPEAKFKRRTEQVKSTESILIAVLSFGAAVVGFVTLVLHLLTGK